MEQRHRERSKRMEEIGDMLEKQFPNCHFVIFITDESTDDHHVYGNAGIFTLMDYQTHLQEMIVEMLANKVEEIRYRAANN